MDVVLPNRIKNEQKFFDSAFKMGFDEMSVHKFLYMFHQSDVDTFPKMGDDRINVLIYGWVLCEEYRLTLPEEEWELPEEIETMLKILVPWSLDIWFSREWERSKLMLRQGLIHCLNRARSMLMRSPDMMQLNWEFLLLYNQTPWQVGYLKGLTVKKEKTLETGGQTIETEELPATSDDLKYIKLEQFPVIVLRLVKLFDQGSIDMVKTLCMRVLSAWNKIYHTELETAGSRLPYVPPEDKRCLLLICHIYLIAVYESDDVKGYVIDNMINNIRFYYQSFQTNNSSYAMDNLSYTPARFIALTAVHLRLQKRELFDFYIWNCTDIPPVNLFGVISQAYKSYLLGNLLMELNNMNEENFASNANLYKRLMNAYVNEREKSELFMLNEIQKQDAQRYAHNIHNHIKITDFKSKICKGNRMGNIGNYENVDDMAENRKENKKLKKVEETEAENEEDSVEQETEEESSVINAENELSVDPIFQNIPNNEEILYYVYEVLNKKSYRGWQFAKIVLLFKIINHELNTLVTWRYHPGLTTSFMLDLETKLSQHYIDLAKIFRDYPFMEQEFWLTAFYLSPTQHSYEAVKRMGIRFNRRRNEDPNRWNTFIENNDAKFGLLSSTIDVKEIVVLTNTEDQNSDYIPLSEALHSLHLPDSVIKDILTVIFLPRNRSFSWAVDWNDLRRRCKMLMNNSNEKKRFVELTMAEANDRLKFLNIDYEKYKNRPQLDYGSIEQGYENLSGDVDNQSDESEEEEDDFEDDEDAYESQKPKRRGGMQKTEEVEVNEDENSEDDDPYLVGKRRTRARTAAAMATLLSSSEITTRRKRRLLEEEMRENEEKLTDNEEKSNDSKSNEDTNATNTKTINRPGPPLLGGNGEESSSSSLSDIQKRNIKECLRERPIISNSTEGFRPLIDMWNVEKKDLQTIETGCVSLLESSRILKRFAKLKNLYCHINPSMSGNKLTGMEQEVEMVMQEDIVGPLGEGNESGECEELKESDCTSRAEMEFKENKGSEQKLPADEKLLEKEHKEMEEMDTEKCEKEKIVSIEKINESNLDLEALNLKESDKEEIPQDFSNQAKMETNFQPSSNEHQMDVKQSLLKEILEKTQDNQESLSELPEIIQNPLENIKDQQSLDKHSEQYVEDPKKLEDIEKASQESSNELKQSHKNIQETEEIKKETRDEKKSIENKPETENVDLNAQLQIAPNESKLKKDFDTFEEENMDDEIKTLEMEKIELPSNNKSDLSEVPQSSKENDTECKKEKEKDIDLKENNYININLSEDVNEIPSSEDKEFASIGEMESSPDKSNTNSEIVNKLNENEMEVNEKEDEIENLENKNIPKTDEIIQISLETSESTDEKSNKEKTNTKPLEKQENKKSKRNLEKIRMNKENSMKTKNSQDDSDKDSKSDSRKDIPTKYDTENESSKNIIAPQAKGITKQEIFDVTFDANMPALEWDEPTILETTQPQSMPSLESETESKDEGSDSQDNMSLKEMEENESKLNLQLQQIKPVKVVLSKLRVSDLTNLRQPKVRIKRVRDVDSGQRSNEQQLPSKRKRIKNRFYFDIDESSDSVLSNSSNSSAYRPPARISHNVARRSKKLQHLTHLQSDSDCDSQKSQKSQTKIRKRRVSTPASNISSKSSSRASTSGSGILVVTPRSASGLKLRISHAEQKPSTSRVKFEPVVVVDEIIQVSSSSNEDEDNDSNTMDSIVEVPEYNESDPLYEEAVIDLHRHR